MRGRNIGVQTGLDDEEDTNLYEVKERLCQLCTQPHEAAAHAFAVTASDSDNDDPEAESQISSDSSGVCDDDGVMARAQSKQSDYLPKKPVTALCVKNDATYALAMAHRPGNWKYHDVNEIYVGGRDCFYSNHVQIVDIELMRPAVKMLCLGAVTKLAFPRDDSPLLYGGTVGGTIYVWDTNTLIASKTVYADALKGHVDPIVVLEFLDDDTLMSVDATGKAFTWSVRNLSEPLSSIEWARPDTPTRASAACCTSSVYCGTFNGRVDRCSVEGGPLETFVAHGTVVNAVAASTVGAFDLLATAAFDCSVKIWDCQNTEEPLYELSNSLDCVTDLAWGVLGEKNDIASDITTPGTAATDRPAPEDASSLSIDDIHRKDPVVDPEGTCDAGSFHQSLEDNVTKKTPHVTREMATNPYFKIPKYDRKLREIAILHPTVMEQLGVYVIPVTSDPAKASAGTPDFGEAPAEGQPTREDNEDAALNSGECHRRLHHSGAATVMKSNLSHIIKESGRQSLSPAAQMCAEMIKAMTPEEKLQYIPRLKETIVYEILKNMQTMESLSAHLASAHIANAH
ncbi:cytoplasmic dynein 1 intermediate chain 2 isoform X1 [Babesia caballi]|uniref:Cytoplasmic dynein 1 intermediate chain 2 isoform X1 n=1 Tax=Babesia caballi TaxID=5871 RepID=A0AAV4LQS8_BABCB|nr:cytoplasmic dynein 1 intermediate chain 2 isoform X1 [Babesia caballi]